MFGSQNHSDPPPTSGDAGTRPSQSPVSATIEGICKADREENCTGKETPVDKLCAFEPLPGFFRSGWAARGLWRSSLLVRRNSEKPTDRPVDPPSRSCCPAASPDSAALGFHS